MPHLVDVFDSPLKSKFAWKSRYAAVPQLLSFHNPALQRPAPHYANAEQRRHVQGGLMNADGSAFSGSEFSRKVHPLRPKPVVNPDDVKARSLIFLSNRQWQSFALFL